MYVTVDPEHRTILVSDHFNHCVKVYSQDGTYLSNFGTAGREGGQLRLPYGVCVDLLGYIIVADWDNKCLVRFSPDGRSSETLVKLDWHPWGVAVDIHGSVAIRDRKSVV
jgi:sugar lactone lactonase YvrE